MIYDIPQGLNSFDPLAFYSCLSFTSSIPTLVPLLFICLIAFSQFTLLPHPLPPHSFILHWVYINSLFFSLFRRFVLRAGDGGPGVSYMTAWALSKPIEMFINYVSFVAGITSVVVRCCL